MFVSPIVRAPEAPESHVDAFRERERLARIAKVNKATARYISDKYGREHVRRLRDCHA